MHAILAAGKQRLVWTEVSDPVPKAGELLINVHAAALNRADLLQRAGMAIGGQWIVIAMLGGAVTKIDMNRFFRRGIKLISSVLRSRPSEMKAKILADLERSLWQSFSSGTIKPVIYKALPIAQAEEAHAILQRRENLGKVVLLVEWNAQCCRSKA